MIESTTTSAHPPVGDERILLDEGTDFRLIEGNTGRIEITATGFARMARAHRSGQDVAIVVNDCELLLMRGRDPSHDLVAPSRRQR